MENKSFILKSTQLALIIQRIVCYFSLLVFYPILSIVMHSIYRYRIVGLKSIRKEFKKICSEVKGPLLVCSNHLTYIDPVIIHWACGSLWYYLFHYNRLLWNFPNARYSQKNWVSRFFFFACKCIPVPRDRYNRKIKDSMQKMRYLLSCNETLLIFPEGKRSVTGKIDNQTLTKGIGRLLQEFNHLPVLCIYLRGESNNNSSIPNKGEKFHLAFKLIIPENNSNDSTAIEDYSSQVRNTLCSMEEIFCNCSRP